MSDYTYTTTPPSATDYNTGLHTGVAPSSATPAALTTTAPGHSNPAALTTTNPGAAAPAALTTTNPGTSAPAALTTTAPGHSNPDTLSTVAPGSADPAALTTTPPASYDPLSAGPASLPTMSSTFAPAFIELSGAGPTLKTLNASAADATANRIVQGTVGGALKSYQVRAGTDAEALPGIVHPVNYNAATNAVVFVQV